MIVIKQKNETRDPRINLKLPTAIVTLIAGAMLVLSINIFHRIDISLETLIRPNVIWMALGVVLAGQRLTKSWLDLLLTASLACIFSFVTFLITSRHGGLKLDNLISAWPYTFMGIFIFSSILNRPNFTKSKLSFEMILLQSASVTYWVLDYSFSETEFSVVKSLILLGAFFLLFPAFWVIRYSILPDANRMILSVWSCLLMIFFGLDNIYSGYSSESTIFLSPEILSGFQYFILGMSSIYILENSMLLTGFLQEKGKLLNAPYFRTFDNLIDNHIARYSQRQTSALPVLWLLLASIAFLLNYHFHIVPKDAAVWCALIICSIFPDKYSDKNLVN